MMDKYKIVVEFVNELIDLPQEVYEEVKATLLSVKAGNKHMTEFLNKSFEFAEERRPKLLEMKGCVM